MPDYRAIAVQAAERNGINPQLFLRQIQQESGFNPHARSSAGAIGIAQIVPKWHPGVNASDPVASLNYAAHLMGTLYKKYGDYQQALSVYNSGKPNAYKDPNFSGGQTFNYVKDIMAGSTPAPVAPVQQPGLGAPAPAPRGLNGLLKQSLAEGDRMLGIPSLNIPTPPAPRIPTAPALPGAGLQPLAPAPTGNLAQWVKVSTTANRAGMALQPGVLNFVGQVAEAYGHPLTIGTGTNHNQYVKGSNRESAHWTGWAADIPSSGAALTKLGQDALIAAGANPKWARQQKGGLFNVNGKQIIFNSMIGGNHFNHLHVGLSRS